MAGQLASLDGILLSMRFDEYISYDAIGLAGLVESGEVGASELLATALERTESVNPRVNAVVRMLTERSKERAQRPLTGPFAGVPFLVKDLGQEYAGVPTSFGCRALAAKPSMEDSTVVTRWKDAGLVIFGQTNTPEFGAKGVTEPKLFGPARNPWDLTCTPGGSSGGAAAAVASGMVPVAGASDGGGSIRIPAACCGLFGLKAGRGLVPSGPTRGEMFHGGATEGVISRSVRDSAAMLDVMVGADPDAPYLPGVGSGYFAEVGRPPGRLRIGVSVSSALNQQPHKEALAAVDDATSLLGDLGHEVEDALLNWDDAELADDFLKAWFVEMATLMADAEEGFKEKNGFELDTRVMAAIARAIRAPEYERVLQRWHRYVRALCSFHRRYDLLLTPTIARPPVAIGELDTPWAERVAASAILALRLSALLPKLGVFRTAIRRNLSWVPYTQLANITGRPAMSVPLYWTGNGLPMGVQFVAPLGGESTLIRLASQLEDARPWSGRRAPGVPW